MYVISQHTTYYTAATACYVNKQTCCCWLECLENPEGILISFGKSFYLFDLGSGGFSWPYLFEYDCQCRALESYDNGFFFGLQLTIIYYTVWQFWLYFMRSFHEEFFYVLAMIM